MSWEALAGLLKDPDVGYLLTGLGTAMAGPNNPMGRLGPAVMGMYTAAAYRDWLSKVLQPQAVAEKQVSQLGTLEQPAAPQAAPQATPQAAPQPAPQPQAAAPQAAAELPRPFVVNPFHGLPDIGSAPLAGLKPEDMRSAIQLAAAQSYMQSEQLKDITNTMFNLAKLEELKKIREETILGMPKTHWEALDATSKGYFVLNYDRQKRGLPPLTFEQYLEKAKEPDLLKTLREVSKDPELLKALATYTGITKPQTLPETAGERAKAEELGKAQAEKMLFPNSKLFMETLNKEMETPGVKQQIVELSQKYPLEDARRLARLTTAFRILADRGWQVVGKPVRQGNVVKFKVNNIDGHTAEVTLGLD